MIQSGLIALSAVQREQQYYKMQVAMMEARTSAMAIAGLYNQVCPPYCAAPSKEYTCRYCRTKRTDKSRNCKNCAGLEVE